jgi:hypothetical protein
VRGFRGAGVSPAILIFLMEQKNRRPFLRQGKRDADAASDGSHIPALCYIQTPSGNEETKTQENRYQARAATKTRLAQA